MVLLTSISYTFSVSQVFVTSQYLCLAVKAPLPFYILTGFSPLSSSMFKTAQKPSCIMQVWNLKMWSVQNHLLWTSMGKRVLLWLPLGLCTVQKSYSWESTSACRISLLLPLLRTFRIGGNSLSRLQICCSIWWWSLKHQLCSSNGQI